MIQGRHGERPGDRDEPRAAPNAGRDIQFGGPAVYRIVVQGVPGTDCSDRLAGLAITTSCRGDRAPHMILAGPLRDTMNFLLLVIRMTMYFNPLRVFLPAAVFFGLFFGD